MVFSIGLGEMLSFVASLGGAGWFLIRMNFNRFEKNLDEKFVQIEKKQDDRFKAVDKKLEAIDSKADEVKRLELEITRNDLRTAQTYSTKADTDKVLERIFTSISRIEECMHDKVSRQEASVMLNGPRKPN